NKEAFDISSDEMPVFGTIASQFNDDGVNVLFNHLIHTINAKSKTQFAVYTADKQKKDILYIVPPERSRYLSEIAETIRKYNTRTKEESLKAQYCFSLKNSIEYYAQHGGDAKILKDLHQKYNEAYSSLDEESKKILQQWEDKKNNYQGEYYTYKVRGREIKVKAFTQSLSHTKIPKVCMPKFKNWGDIIEWSMQENVPGEFPYTAGVYPFKREDENPTRMFAGEGIAERTNKRFHYLSYNMPAVRLSTAFDSVTLYGFNPDKRPDIYGKIGNSGVSISTVDDVKRLYSGFKLTDPNTSVSMTINGPAPIMAAYFFNAAIDQECELYIQQNGLTDEVKRKIQELYQKRNATPPVYRATQLPDGHNGLGLLLLGIPGDMVVPAEVYHNIKNHTLRTVRGTVQADILKEEQAQNTCIFSVDFALKLMGDMQEYFVKHTINNFYSVSISGYHIAEAGANPITQLAFTLANGFTYVEYYLARGLHIDDFAPNLSFFFSNGLDPEYSVIGRVARRIW
ncbi:MAG: methylmalonyl-CoA mutase, partial [Spirochaetes bacterium]|nr:methylmalonyl-CoA mutase [Spirochaetota bacterium]